MTLKEYLEDYASPETKAIGEKVIAREIPALLNERDRKNVEPNIEEIAHGQRDFRLQ